VLALALALGLGCSGGDGTGDEDRGGEEEAEPRRAPAGAAQVVQPGDVGDVDLAPVQGAMGTETVHVAVTGSGEVDEVGQGEAATLPAVGERFVVAEVVVTPVPPSPVLDQYTQGEVAQRGRPDFDVGVPGGDADDVEIEVDETSGPQTHLVAASVPESAGSVDLVMTFDDVQQRLSLLTGAPGPGNAAVLARAHRDMAAPAPGRSLTFHRMELGLSEHVTETVTITGASLQWVPGLRVVTPAPAGRAFLHVAFDVSSANWHLASELRLADGTVLPPLDVTSDPEVLAGVTVPVLVFDVPADFAEGTLVVGKDYSFEIPTGVGSIAADFDGTVEFPIAIPAT
jgi:hypothetical protein